MSVFSYCFVNVKFTLFDFQKLGVGGECDVYGKTNPVGFYYADCRSQFCDFSKNIIYHKMVQYSNDKDTFFLCF